MLQSLQLGLVRQFTPQPDINKPHGAGVLPRGIDQQPRLVRPKGDGDIGPHGGPPHLTAVRIDPTGQIDGDDNPPSLRGKPRQPRGIGPQPTPPSDPDDPVKDKIGTEEQFLGITGCDGPPTRPQQRREPTRMSPLGREQHGHHPGPRRASRAPAYRASPPLSPLPTSSTTRLP